MDTKITETDKAVSETSKSVGEQNKQPDASAKTGNKTEAKSKSEAKPEAKAASAKVKSSNTESNKQAVPVKKDEKISKLETETSKDTHSEFILHTIKTPVPAYLGRHLDSLCLGMIQGDVYIDKKPVNGFITCIFGGYERGSVTGYIPKEYIGNI